ncbi:MAG: site-2 protease family protein [Planctomycetia bacterium]|nr:site-2 protease family protein [Planctomycetia bacterium]
MDFSIAALLGVSEDASAWANILSVFWRVLIVLLGVNMLVIVHEFGHFIVARLCGVRCDKFYIWFDAYGFKFFSFKRGDTEYGLGWLPLGGYVQMFGQVDNPSGIQAEIERAKANYNETLEKDVSEEDKAKSREEVERLENQLYAPDSYLSKNVFQRMAIISAGVIMNIIFAIICATLAALIGTPETSARIGYVAPGSPAWRAGFHSGDQLVQIDGNVDPIFSSILVSCMDGKELDIKALRFGQSEPVELHVTPKVEKGGLTPMIGVGPSPSLELALLDDHMPYDLSFDAEEYDRIVSNLSALKGGERLKSMNGHAVETIGDYLQLSHYFIDEPIEYVFAPTLEKSAGEREVDPNGAAITVTIPATRAPDIGVRLTMGEIVSILPNSPAAKAGLRARELNEEGNVVHFGDILVDIDNEPIQDPRLLPYQLFFASGKRLSDAPLSDQSNLANAGSHVVAVTVVREDERLDFSIPLSSNQSYTGFSSSHGVMACNALGIAYEVRPIVSGVDNTVSFEGSPLGGKITSIKATIPCPKHDVPKYWREVFKSLTGKKVNGQEANSPVEIELTVGGKGATESEEAQAVLKWFSDVLPYLPDGTPVTLTVSSLNGETVTASTRVKREAGAYLADRGLYFNVDCVYRRSTNLSEALSFGWSKTLESASQVFIFLKNVGKNVSAKALGGPGMIVGTAYQAAGRKDGVFLLFLCLISANLAVVNFLPIPVLDGGHMVFLLYEAITRRKPNEKVQIGLSYIGFVLILALMFWVIFLDIVRYCFS